MNSAAPLREKSIGPACLYISRYAPERSPTDPYFGLPRFLARHCRLYAVWGKPRRAVPFAASCEAIVEVGSSYVDLPSAVLQTLALSRAGRPEFVVCCVEEFALLVGWMTSRWEGRPYFVVVQDPPFTGRYEGRLGLRRRIERHLRRWMLGKLLAASDGVFCFIERQALSEFVGTQCRVVELRTGTSEEACRWGRKHRRAQPAAGELSAEYTIGYVGAIDQEQGIPELVEAVSMVRRAVPNVRARLIGPVDRSWNEAFQAELKQRELTHVIEVTGWVGYEEMLQRLLTCDVCCHVRRPTPWAYAAYPLKICEYLACERPVVSWDYPGCRTLLGGGQLARLVPPGDVHALADALIRLSERPARKEIEHRIRQQKDDLTAESSYRKLLALCRQASDVKALSRRT